MSSNRKVSYQYSRALFDCIHNLGIGVLVKGQVLTWKDGGASPSGMLPDETVESHIILNDDWEALFSAHADKKEIGLLKNVLIMKDKDKNIITAKIGEAEQKYIDMLNAYNINLMDSSIELGGIAYHIQASKTFSNSEFKFGGRTYLSGVGGYMYMLQKDNRPHIRFNGEDTVEIDFVSLHPRMIAEIEGEQLDYDFDPYEISIDTVTHTYDKKMVRSIAKVALLQMFCAGSPLSAARALNKFILDDVRNTETGFIEQAKKEGKLPQSIPTKEIIDKLLHRNSYAMRYFFTECGLSLQNKDSKIMDYCIDYFNQSGEIILPIHDSLIIREGCKDEAIRVMTDAYEHIMGSKMNCKLKVESKNSPPLKLS
jgi:hypothetical protein